MLLFVWIIKEKKEEDKFNSASELTLFSLKNCSPNVSEEQYQGFDLSAKNKRNSCLI